MAEPIAQQSLDKLNAGDDLSIEAPEWSTENGTALLLRALLAGLLLVLVAAVVHAVSTPLPGEAGAQSTVTALQERARSATSEASRALADRRDATRRLDEARRAAVRATTSGAASRGQVARATRERDLAKLDWEQAVALHEQLLEEQRAATDDLLAASPGSDLDLVRAIGAGVLAVLALIAAGALLAPRRSQTLKVRKVYGPAVAAGGGGGGDGGGVRTALADPAATTPAAPGGGVTRVEPALTQGVVGAVVLAAGLFGIQNLEGTAEVVLNLALPLVPVLGALFARSRVVPRPHLSPEERARHFGD